MKSVDRLDVQSLLARDWRLIEQAKSDQWLAQKAAITCRRHPIGR